MKKSDLRTEMLFLAIFVTMISSLIFYKTESVANFNQTHLFIIGFVGVFGFVLMLNLSRGR